MKYKYEDLEGWIDVVLDIQCTVRGCIEGDSLHGVDEYNAAEEFFKNGWRSTGTNCYCPTHAKQKLKG